jgi:hypothetical protein
MKKKESSILLKTKKEFDITPDGTTDEQQFT